MFVCMSVLLCILSKLPNFALGCIFKLIHVNDDVDSGDNDNDDDDNNDTNICTF